MGAKLHKNHELHLIYIGKKFFLPLFRAFSHLFAHRMKRYHEEKDTYGSQHSCPFIAPYEAEGDKKDSTHAMELLKTWMHTGATSEPVHQ